MTQIRLCQGRLGGPGDQEDLGYQGNFWRNQKSTQEFLVHLEFLHHL